jgi:hypothetical protein
MAISVFFWDFQGGPDNGKRGQYFLQMIPASAASVFVISLWQMSASTSTLAVNRLRILALHGFGQTGEMLRIKSV